MISCELNYNEKTPDGRLILRCAGVGSFPVFSGLGSYKNTVEFAGRRNGPIPLGKYLIVERSWGGLWSTERTIEKRWKTGNRYWEWFALFRQDTLLDDTLSIDGISRGYFRLHPLRPDGTGASDGCVTFYNEADFNRLRHALLSTAKLYATCEALRAYGELTVTGVPFAKLPR
ncbi:DUF2778 domain-containing protein [Cronobacter muytjensii]